MADDGHSNAAADVAAAEPAAGAPRRGPKRKRTEALEPKALKAFASVEHQKGVVRLASLSSTTQL